MSGLCDPRINLAARQMSAFARFCSLCHLDLDLLRAVQILAGHAETSRCHLLDRRTAVKSVCPQRQSLFVFSAFARIGFAVQSVHGDRHRLMRFLGNRSIGHRARLESGHDRIDALHFLDRNCLFRIVEIHQSPQVLYAVLICDSRRILLEHLVVPASCGLLQKMDRLRIVKVLVRTASHLVMSRVVQRQVCGKTKRIKRHGM